LSAESADDSDVSADSAVPELRVWAPYW